MSVVYHRGAVIVLCCLLLLLFFCFFFFNDTATTEIYTLSLHDALPISFRGSMVGASAKTGDRDIQSPLLTLRMSRSEEHTSELQSPYDLVCRLLLEKKKKKPKRQRKKRHRRSSGTRKWQ